MAMMRTNRLVSKTTTPPRKLTSASELESQDAAYNKYQGDMSSYNEKMSKYNKEQDFYKKNPRTYANWGGKQNTRLLNEGELSAFNKAQGSEYSWVRTDKGFKGNAADLKGYHAGLAKPTAPSKVSPADWSNVQLDKMATNKAKITTKKGSLKQYKATEKPTFEAPSRNVSTMGTKAAKTGGKSGLVRATNPKGELGAARAGVVKTKTPAGYKRETKQFESYVASGADQTKSMFKAEAKTSKGLAKQYKAEGNAEGVKMMRDEAKQYKRAAQFAGKLSNQKNKFYDKSMVQPFRASK
jgi:Tfp pilus assembly protein PilW